MVAASSTPLQTHLFRHWRRAVGDHDDLLGRTLLALREHGRYALIGAAGVSALTTTLLRRDLDVVVATSEIPTIEGTRRARAGNAVMVTSDESGARVVFHRRRDAATVCERAVDGELCGMPVRSARPEDLVATAQERRLDLLDLALIAQLIERDPGLRVLLRPAALSAFQPIESGR